MIDVSQWRASIGLWNYCQAASSRPANGHHSHSFKAAVDSKSGITTSGEKTSKLPAALSLIALLLLLFYSPSLLRHILMIPPLGNCYQVQCTTGVTVTDTNYLQSVVLPGGSSSNLIYNDLYLIVCLDKLLLLSGDVELNPGPMIDDQPDISLLIQWLEPLVDWQSFGLLLPGITQQDITTIENLAVDTEQSKGALFSKWLQKNPTATWRDVLNALTKREEINLLQTINDQLQVHQGTGGNTDAPTSTVPVVSTDVPTTSTIPVVPTDDPTTSTIPVVSTDAPTSTVPVVSTVSSSVSVINKPVTSTTSGNPKDILRTHSYKLVHAISVNLYNVTDALYAKDLIPQQAKEEMHVLGVTDNEKSSKLVKVIEQQLEFSLNQEQYLIDICHVLINQHHHTLTDIATSILHQLGQSIPDNVTSISSIPDDVQGYADNMRQHYKHQPIVATDWPPRIGKQYFGRLALVEKQDCSTQAESAWHLLRGQVDKIVKLTENKEISVEDVLQPTDSSLSLRVVIDGSPGIGKTTLCRKLLNMWSNGTLVHQQYDLVLYCPLRNSKIATATTLADLFVHQRFKIPMVAKWFEKRNGEGLLIIFDGWDELSEQLRQSSLAASIICKNELDQCSVIVTSRSYASSSLLEIMSNLSRHVQVIGFTEEEISTVIIQTLQKDTKLAQELIDENTERMKYNKSHFTTTQSSKDSQLAVKLINDLEVRNDVQSLCYLPLVCSMVILVYCKEGGHLPTTLTQLYENFILQTIRRHVKRHDINPRTLGSLSSLPSQLAKPLQEMCQLAYTNLANTRMTFSSHQLQSLSEAVKEDYLGLMTRFTEHDEEKYQFLHLSIQEFLAAWWIAKHEKKREEVFKDHIDDDHFRMCLRFVAGLTHLEHESYQQYFNEQQLDLQCKREPLFGFETCHLSYFYQDPEIRIQVAMNDHISSDDIDNVPILLLQLLYESQNTTLCQVIAQSINNHSLCLYEASLSLFDWLCLSYCINNSNTTWNHLHLGNVFHQELSVFTAGLTNNSLQTQCKRLVLRLDEPTDESIHKLLQSSLLYNIQECYCVLDEGQYVPCLVLLQFLNLPQLKILHLIMNYVTIPTVDNIYTDKCTELEKCIEMNSTLQEMKIEYEGKEEISSTITSVIRGVTRNKTITSLTLCINAPPPPLPDGVIEQLLKDNNILQALSLYIDDRLLPSSLNIVEVNTPLTALEIGEESNALLTLSFLPHIKGLHCLILPDPYPPRLLFLSHPSLHTLTLPLDTAESAIELFTILQTNTTLKAMSVEIKEERVYTSSMGTSLQDMLIQNQTLKYLKINKPIPSSFLSFLKTGLRHHTSLQQLSASIPLPLNEEIRTFINLISQKNNLTEIKMTFTPNQSYSNNSRKEKEQIMTPLFYEQVLPAVTNMLQSHTTIRLLRIECKYINYESSQPNWIESVQHLYETIFIHPSFECIAIDTESTLLVDTLKDQKKTLIDRHRKEQPHKPLPILNLAEIKSYNDLFSKETQENLERALKESGSIKYKVSVAIVQGEARVGKTSIKSLILKLPYSEVSTSCIEAPCMAFSINRYGSDDGISYRLVSDDEMDDIVITKFKEIASHSKNQNEAIERHTAANKPVQQEVAYKAAKSYAPDNIKPTSPKAINSLTSKAVQNFIFEDSGVTGVPVVDSPVDNIDVPVHEEKMDVDSEETKDKQNVDVLKQLTSKHHTSKVGFDRNWLYFFDSGGQIQFQKLLLAFMPCSSVLVLVVDLAKNLNDRSSILMQLPDGTIAVDEHSLKVEDMLKQVLSVVASNTKYFRSKTKNQQHIKAPKNEKLQVITIGTHGDKRNTGVENIEAKTRKLKSILKSESIQIAYKDDAQLLHEVDGSKAKRGEFDDDPTINAIRKALNEQAYQIEVPLQWHCFGVILRNEAKDGILELSSCEEFGESLGMSKDEVQSALQFFHELKLLFYYHDSPAKDIVFVKLDAIINIIRKLMVDICKPCSTLEAGPDELAQLAAKGYLSMKVLKMYTGALEGREDILLDLFVHLKIAALIPTESDQTKKEDKVFLMPALLPVKDVSDPSTFSKTPPLLYYFNDEPVPMGLFCAVIVQLLSYPGDEKWHIITERSYSNFFTIQKKYSLCQVILVEQLKCIEIYCEHCFSKQNIKESIKKAIDDVMKHKLSDNEKPIPAFYCPCNGKRDHIAEVEVQDGTNNVVIVCKTKGNLQLSESECDWFTIHNNEEGEYEFNASSAGIIIIF
uniref:NACHT domain-containing protein n=1 Tax=Amphimedon queenslandica TaxID=400682 RepID=A0A1X7T4P5_AMPQE